MKVEARAATDADARRLASEMRAADRREVWLSHGHTPAEAAHVSIDRSMWALACYWDGGLLCIIGVGGALWGRTRAPWMLGTDRIAARPWPILRHSRPVVQEMRRGAERLENWTHAGNILARRWLAWCGFTVHEPEPYGAFGAPFCRFEMEGLPDV